MARVGYKLQEFVAHTGNVNCLSFGKKNCRLFITGGDDQKVNLWSVGKPTSLMSLCGHTSPVESAAFDSAEVSVVAGSSSGAIKLWDLEETKTVRTLTGHRSYCTALEFHPFGELFASGSMDTNLKIWDIRKKGCIHTYKGHTRGISTIRFTPDGRWVVSGGFDNVVKVWDLTAGKLLHDLKFHEGRIRSIEFHPLEFLLATGSADKTVKFWDLETFEMIGSSRCEVSGVRSMTFHPDGRTLFCGLDDSLKVYSWEPVICHDSVNMGWSTLGDLCIHDGKLLGGAYYENSVAVWVLDASLVEPYGAKAATKQQSDSDEIKTIYVDCVNPVAPKEVGPAVYSPEPKDIRTVGIQKRAPAVNKSIVSRDGPGGKNPEASRRESMSSVRTGGCPPVKPTHVRRLSTGKFDMRRMSDSLDSTPRDTAKSSFCGRKKEMNIRSSLVSDGNAKKLPETKQFSSIESVAGKFKRHLSAAISSSGDKVNEVAIVHGKTLNSVERFERKKKVEMDEIQTPDRNGDGEIVTREPSASGENAVIENLMQSHDLLLNTFRSRLTKLEAVVHFWERNDIKGAINVVAKLPDHSVQADVIGVLVDRIELITLDLFSCLLPVLLDLLDSKVERHASISLEMLLKLVAVFGTLIRTTLSGPRVVEVNNLNADESLECCKQCYSHLQSVKMILPDLVKRGSDVTRYAQQLTLVLNRT